MTQAVFLSRPGSKSLKILKHWKEIAAHCVSSILLKIVFVIMAKRQSDIKN